MSPEPRDSAPDGVNRVIVKPGMPEELTYPPFTANQLAGGLGPTAP